MNSVARKTGVVLLAIAMSGLFTGRALHAAEPEEITVSAAIAFKNVFEEMGKRLEAENSSLRIRFNFGASGDLMAQIKAGAPVDVFASTGIREMEFLFKEGMVLKETQADFASNSMVLIVPTASTLSIASFGDLAKPEVKKIAAGNPNTVPSGRYAEEVFHSFKVFDAFGDKRILTENVRQTLDYAARGEVDAGVVYMTDAMTRQQEVRIAAVAPEASHSPILYPIAVIKGSKHEPAARLFVAFILGEEGQKILKTHGFKPPQN